MHGHVSKRIARSPPRMRASHKRPATARRLVEPPAAAASLWVRIQRREWMTEEDARAYRHRSLLQDNPTSS
jgi:hypothetical protein